MIQDRIRAIVHRLRSSRLVAALALALFGAGIVLSLRANPGLLLGLDWQAVSVLLPLTLLVILLGGIETRLLANGLGGQMALAEALRFTAYGSAANILPIPGAAMVRVAALQKSGARIRGASGVTLGAGLVWLGVAFLVAGLSIYAMEPWLSVGISSFGVSLFAAGLAIARGSGLGVRFCAGVIVIKLVSIGVEIARYTVVITALGYPVGWTQSTLVSTAGALGSAVGIAPGGLGIREGAAAAFAAIVSLPPEVGFMAAALNRCVMLSLLAAFSIMILTRSRKGRGYAAS